VSMTGCRRNDFGSAGRIAKIAAVALEQIGEGPLLPRPICPSGRVAKILSSSRGKKIFLFF
jgi:hypothetical protein